MSIKPANNEICPGRKSLEQDGAKTQEPTDTEKDFAMNAYWKYFTYDTYLGLWVAERSCAAAAAFCMDHDKHIAHSHTCICILIYIYICIHI